MSRGISSGATFAGTPAPVSGPPLSASLIAKFGSVTSGRLFVIDNGTTTHRLLMDISSGSIRCVASDAGGSGIATATATVGTGSFVHAGAVWASATDRRAFAQGANKGTNATSRTPSGLSTFRLGSGPSNETPATMDAGLLALWNIALSDSEMLSLGGGAWPGTIQPASLIDIWTLDGTGDEVGMVNGLVLSQVGSPTTTANQQLASATFPTGEALALVVAGDDFGLWEFGEWPMSEGAIVYEEAYGVSGFALSTSLGDPTRQISSNPAPAGFPLTLSLGNESLNISSSLSPSGLALALTLGAPTFVLSPNLAPIGFQLALSQGVVVPAISSTASPSGLGLTLALGDETIGLGPNILVLGLALETSLGEVSLEVTSATTISGLALAFSLGEAPPQIFSESAPPDDEAFVDVVDPEAEGYLDVSPAEESIYADV